MSSLLILKADFLVSPHFEEARKVEWRSPSESPNPMETCFMDERDYRQKDCSAFKNKFTYFDKHEDGSVNNWHVRDEDTVISPRGRTHGRDGTSPASVHPFIITSGDGELVIKRRVALGRHFRRVGRQESG